MRRLTWLALAALVGGVALLAYSAATGEGRVVLFLIFPVFTGSGLASFGGMLLIVLGLFLGFLSMAGFGLPSMEPPPPALAPQAPQASPAKKFGGVVFLGPIPIVFGSDARVSKWMLVLAVVMTVVLVAFFFLVLTLPP